MTLSKKLYSLLIIAVTLCVLAFVLFIIDGAPRTDDAWVYADKINVVPQVNGQLVELPVRDNQFVHKGDLLYKIDPRPYQNSLDAAQARLATLNEQIKLEQRSISSQQYNAGAVAAQVARAREQYIQATNAYNRRLALVGKAYVSREELDQAKANAKSAKAALDAAQLQAQQAQAAVTGVDALLAQRRELQVQIDQAKLNLSYSEERAPFDGRIASLRTTIGQYVSPTQPVMTLIDTGRWYVMANYRETDLKNIVPGTPARIFIMGDTSKRFSGKVDSISYGVAPEDGGNISNGLPDVARNINWVHVSQRFQVKIKVDNPDPQLFRVGASATAILYRENKAAGAKK